MSDSCFCSGTTLQAVFYRVCAQKPVVTTSFCISDGVCLVTLLLSSSLISGLSFEKALMLLADDVDHWTFCSPTGLLIPDHLLRKQVKLHQYKSWSAFVDDFKLMSNNAMLYNQKRSRVHKTAVTMLRAGIKQLQHIEVEGCKALGCPVPIVAPSVAPTLESQPTRDAAGVSNPSSSAGRVDADSLPQPAARAPVKPPPKPAPPKKPLKLSPPKKARGAPLKGSSGNFLLHTVLGKACLSNWSVHQQ